MQKNINLKTPDGFTIYGTLDACNKARTLLIFVHGLTGKRDEHHYFNAAPFFNSHGFDTYRFDFYSQSEGSRQLSESTITTHVQDLELVTKHFKDRYDELVFVGHSFGPVVILRSDLTNISKLVLWDPSSQLENIKDKGGYFNDKINKYVLEWGMDIVLCPEMIEEWKEVTLKKLIDNVAIPCKFIFAGNSSKHEKWQPHFKDIKVEYESVVIKNATHGFVEPGTEQELFEETLKWLKK